MDFAVGLCTLKLSTFAKVAWYSRACCVGRGEEMEDAVDLRDGDKVHVWNSYLYTLDIDEEKPGNRDTARDLIRPKGVVVKGKKRASWRRVLENIRKKVRVAPIGPFDRTDVIWETKANHGKRRRQETKQVTIS